MSTINRLSSVDALQSSDQLPVWDSSNGDTRKASLNTLLAFIEANFADPDYTTRIVEPAASGWNIDIGDTGTSSWLIINPVTDYALGSVSLPSSTFAVNGQEVIVVCTSAVTAFSLTSSGATVTGYPLGLVDYTSFRVRYNAEQLTWYTLDNDLAPGFASLISYTPAGTGAVVESVQNKLRDSVSVKDFGAKGDGSTDDLAAFQATIAHCVATNRAEFYAPPPAAFYSLSADLDITVGFRAGMYRVFGGAGQVKFKTATVTNVFPEWWGTNTTPGVTDMGPAIQSAVIAAGGANVRLSPAEYVCAAPITLYSGTQITGIGQYTCILNFTSSSGFIISNAGNLILRDFEIARTPRYKDTSNTSTGLHLNGTSSLISANHVIENVFIDGFETAVKADYVYTSTFRRLATANGKNGIICSGLNVNNTITDCSLIADTNTTGIGISFAFANEGWRISDTLFYGFGYSAISGNSTSNNHVINNIIDGCGRNGIVLEDDGTNACMNWYIANNFIGIIAATGDFGIVDNSTGAGPTGQNNGHSIIGNQIVKYSAGTMTRGIDVSAANVGPHKIIGNSIWGTTQYDIVGNTKSIISGNACNSTGGTANISGGAIVTDNTGNIVYQRAVQHAVIGQLEITYDEAVPTVGTWSRGSMCLNVTATAGGIPGWVCVVAGTPGTWKAMGVLAV